MGSGTPVLMYHELVVDGRALCDTDEGYARYCIADPVFRSHLDWLRANDYRGWNLTQALSLDGNGERGVAITFDDGCETDLLNAAPVLLDAGFSATFFIVSGWVGRHGYLSTAQLREMTAMGLEIGAHSRSHPFLPDLDRDAMRAEIMQCKNDLEQRIGRGVDHFSCPGGRWSHVVREFAREAGYRSVSTSRPGALTAATDRFRLPRTAIVAGMSAEEFARICRGEREWLREARSLVLSGAKRLVGNALYDRVRSAVLNR